MQLIECPWCGPREEVEFHYGGQAHVSYPEDPARAVGREVGRVPVRPRQHPGSVRGAVGARARLPPLVQRDPRHRHLPLPPCLPPRRAEAGTCHERDRERRRGAVPAAHRRPDRPRRHPPVHLRRTDADRPPRRHPGVGAARPRRAPDGYQHQARPAPRDRGSLGGGPEQPRPGRGAVPRADAAGHHHRADRRARGARHPRPGPARRRAGLRPLRRPPRARRPARGRRGADRPHGRADGRPGGRARRTGRRAVRGGRLAPGHRRPHRRLRPRWSGSSGPPPSWRAIPDVVHLQRTTAFGHFDDGFVLALERRTDHLGAAAPRHLSRQRVWRIRARRVLVAAGAHERPVVFTDNDRPGIMLAGGARTFLHRYGVLAGRAAVVFTTDDSAYAAAVDLADAGAEVRAVVDARPEPPAQWVGGVREPWHPGPRRAGRHGHGRRRAGERRTGGAAPRRRARRAGAHRLRPAAGQRWLEPRGAPVQPGGRPAALRRRARRVRPGRRAGPDDASPGRRPGCSTSPAASPRVAARPWPRSTASVSRSAGADDLPDRRRRAGPRTHAGAVAGAGHRRDHPQHCSSSTCSATPRSPTSPAPSTRACGRSSTSSATRRSARRTTRERPPA